MCIHIRQRRRILLRGAAGALPVGAYRGRKLLGLKPTSIRPPAFLPSLRHAFGEGPEKRWARNPEARLLPSSPVLLAPGCAHGHREQLLPPPATAAARRPGTPEFTRATLKEKLQKLRNAVCGDLKCSSQGEVVIIAGFNLGIRSLLSFYFTRGSSPTPG